MPDLMPVGGTLRLPSLAVSVNDETEFDRFFVAHFDDLVRSLTAITGDRERAADCVQEAFVKAYARWRRVGKLDNPVTWVRRVAINASRDAHRSERRRSKREDRALAAVPMVAPGVEQGVASEMNAIDLLRSLPKQQRAVAALFYLEDASINEIADSMRISTGAVKFHLNRARKNLRQGLEDHGDV